ncbi:hypothetical protein OWR29_28930 [Actinoplanes sp. Pm04-4]|uniref:Uncharacterized protein n=1 Tax=Paractinoplanes pyxinae TaxID=2997416 RepID=A0ABT4B6B1_9ACTN|nr:hypothetical protein [Actinoplanes pyxinae]MCY1142037.1 hypothetical protein [Actinoplanes pyxinae]
MTTHKEHAVTTGAPPATAELRLTPLASQCGAGSCPTVYGTDRATLVVQGYVVAGENTDVDVPGGEQLVEIPVEVLLAAADKIRGQA